MKKPELTADIFTFRYKGKNVIYAPLRQVIMLANDETINLLAEIKAGNYRENGNEKENRVISLLREKGIIDGEPVKLPQPPNSKEFQPISVTLFPTNQCNMRCIYCYASAGEAPVSGMNFSMAKAAIDLIADNAKKLNEKHFSVGFHGGGEPTLRWDFLVKTVEYGKKLASELGLEATFSASTNGIFSAQKVDWIIKNMTSLSISLDGPLDIQNMQRPLADGGDSYGQVAETLRRMDEAKFNYGLRSTITTYNVMSMKKTVAFFLDNFHPQRIQFEPLFLCGRCLTTKIKSPDPRTFIREFMKAEKLAAKRGARLTYSGLRIEGVTTTFCGASGSNFALTPEGYITSCFEVLEKSDHRSDLFFYGRWNPEKVEFEIYEDKRNYLLSLHVRNFSYCENCVAKWHCAGDCLAKVAYEGDVEGDRGSDRCWMNQEVTKRKIVQLFVHPPAAAPVKANL